MSDQEKPTSIRRLLNEYDFDWERGVVVVPGTSGQNIFLPLTSPVLDREFVLIGTETNGVPVFTAEDPMAMYVLCNYPEAGVSVFQKVDAADLEGVELSGIQGYPHGPSNAGVNLEFTTNNLEVFLTQGRCYPAVVGCPEIHFYCIAGDRKEVMDIFTMRLLSGYLAMKEMKGKGVKEGQGYVKLLERLFYDKLGVKEYGLDPITKTSK